MNTEELYQQALQNYYSYLDLVWDIYNAEQYGVLPIRI